MTDKVIRQKDDHPPILLGSRLSQAFEHLEEMIRERAYQIFLDRDSAPGDSMADWLQAQSEVFKPIELAIKEQKHSVVAECDLKGFSPEEIEVEVQNGVLKVFGSHRESSTRKKGKATESRSENLYFFQSAQLPVDVDLEESHAKLFKNGKLKVTLPKSSGKTSGKK